LIGVPSGSGEEINNGAGNDGESKNDSGEYFFHKLFLEFSY
jgi:hypothetical protein